MHFSHLVGELADALYQILVGLPVSSNHLSQNWNHLETVSVIKPEKWKRIQVTCRAKNGFLRTGICCQSQMSLKSTYVFAMFS